MAAAESVPPRRRNFVPALRYSAQMADLAPMREQVYTDPRPKEYFDRFHERARTHEPN